MMRIQFWVVMLLALAVPDVARAYPGEVDAAFGQNGIAKIDLGYKEAIACGALDASKRILLGGAIEGADFTGSDMLIVRLRKNGVLDTGNFGGDLNNDMIPDGFVTLDLGESSDETVAKIVIDDQDRIYAIGSLLDLGGTYRPVISRFLSNGELDTTWGPPANAGTIYFCSDGRPVDAARDVDGNFFIYGDNPAVIPINAKYAILDENGGTTVGCALNSPSNFLLADDAAAISIQPDDGNVCVAGGTANDLYVTRFVGTTATKDNNFDGDGHAVLGHLQVSGNAGTIISVADLAIDGKASRPHYNKCVVAGSADGAYLLARFTVDGDLDTTFSGDGIKTIDFGGTEWGRAIAIDGKGRIVIAGETNGDIGLTRVKPKGGLDKNFGFNTGGLVTTSFNGRAHVRDVLINRKANRILVVGSWGNQLNDILVVRYKSK